MRSPSAWPDGSKTQFKPPENWDQSKINDVSFVLRRGAEIRNADVDHVEFEIRRRLLADRKRRNDAEGDNDEHQQIGGDRVAGEPRNEALLLGMIFLSHYLSSDTTFCVSSVSSAPAMRTFRPLMGDSRAVRLIRSPAIPVASR